MNHGNILWLRHAEVSENRIYNHVSDKALVTKAGLEAAREQLRSIEIDRPRLIFSSPLQRAVQTADLVSNVFSGPLPQTNAVFSEWRPPRLMVDVPPIEEPWFYDAWRSHRLAYPNSTFDHSESVAAFARRAQLALSLASSAAVDGGTIVVVSHKVLIGAVAAIHGGARGASEIFESAKCTSLSNLDWLWLSS